MIRIASVTIKPDDRLGYQHQQLVKENGGYRVALFKHVQNEYTALGNGRVQLNSLRYERQA